MHTGEESDELLRRWKQGDETAATLLHARYATRLTALARVRLAGKLAARFDAEDVVQSAYRSFFLRARAGEFTIEESGQLWRLLVTVTLRKLWRRVKHHQAERRSVDAEYSAGGDAGMNDTIEAAVAREPSPAAVAEVSCQLETLMAPLPAEQRRALQLRLQDYTIAEIAAELKRSQRTIRRWLDNIKTRLTQPGES